MLFNIYYINFPKVYEIKMMLSNIIGNKIEWQSNAGKQKEEEIKAKLGAVWIDTNKDGVKDANEQRVSGVKVLLLDNSTSNIAISSNNEQCITTTGTDGSYMFNNVPQGKYSVIFFCNCCYLVFSFIVYCFIYCI